MIERENGSNVIQCNASNVHGYAFTQGYLNVLMRTNVTIGVTTNQSVDVLTFVYHCNATSDPSTPPTVRWYKTEPSEVLVRDDPPYVVVGKESLTMLVFQSCSGCAKHLGEYMCVGDNGYSRENRTITHSYQLGLPTEDITRDSKTWTLLNIILVVAIVGIVLLLVGIFLCFCWKCRSSGVKRQAIKRELPNPVSIYEDVGYDSIGVPLDELIIGSERPMIKESGEYDQIGYDSIDQVIEEIGEIGYAMPQLHDAQGQSGYESLDGRPREVVVRGKPELEKEIIRDDAGYLMPLDEAANGDGTGQRQVKDKEIMGDDVGHTNMILKEANQFLDLVCNEVDPYLDLDPMGVSPYLDLNPKKVDSDLELDQEEVNQYLDLVSNEVNPNMDLVSNEKSQYLDLDQKDANQCTDLGPKNAN